MPQQLAIWFFSIFYTLAVVATMMMEMELRPWWTGGFERAVILTLLAMVAWPVIIAYEIVELHQGRLVGEARP